MLKCNAAALLVLVGVALSGPASAQTGQITECGQELSAGTYELTEDLDCTLEGGTARRLPAIIVNGDNVTIEGNGYRILAPDANRAIQAENKKNVTIRNIAVDGWCNGTGIYISGGVHGAGDPGHVLENIDANGRGYGVHIRNTSKVQIRDLQTDSAATAGLYLENVSQSIDAPLIMRGLKLDNSAVGLRIVGLNGADATCAGNDRNCNYTIHSWLPDGLDANANAAVITSIDRSDTGINFAGTVTNVTVLGPESGEQVVFNGYLYGIYADWSTNAALTFRNLDVSSNWGVGTGIMARGDHLVIDRITAERREHGVYTTAASNQVIRRVTARGVSNTGLYLNSPVAPLLLEELTLEDCGTALAINAFQGPTTGPRFAITAWHDGAGGTIRSVKDSDIGLFLTNVRDISVGAAPADPAAPDFGLAFDNRTYGIRADSTTNARIIFTNLNLTHRRQVAGYGLDLAGIGHEIRHIFAERRATGLRLTNPTGSAMVFDDIRIARSTTGLNLTGITDTSTWPSFQRVKLGLNVNALYLSGWRRTFEINRTLIDTTPIDDADTDITTGVIDVANSDNGIVLDDVRNLTLKRLVLGNATTGITSADTNSTLEDIQITDCILSGRGLGTGLYLSRGRRITVSNVTSDRRNIGMEFATIDALRLLGNRARKNGTGVYIREIQRVTRAGLWVVAATMPFANQIDLQDNGRGLSLSDWNARESDATAYYPVTGQPHDGVATIGLWGVDVGTSDEGLNLASTRWMVIRDWVMANRNRSIYANNMQQMVLENLDLSGQGAGSGFNCRDDGYGGRCGTELVFRNITVNDRSDSIWPGGAFYANGNAMTFDDIRIDAANGTGLLVKMTVPSGETPVLPVLRKLSVTRSRVAVSLHNLVGTAANPFLVGPFDTIADTGAFADLSDNLTTLRLTSCSHVHVAGVDVVTPWLLPGRDVSIEAVTGNTSLRFANLDLSGTGGVGLSASGTGHRFEDIRVSGRFVGCSFSSVTDPVVRRISVDGARDQGVLFTSLTNNGGLVLDDLDLRDNARGLWISGYSGTTALTLDANNFVPSGLAGSPIGIGAIAGTAPATITVDTASLGLTASGQTNSVLHYLTPLSGDDHALCGTTLAAGTTLTLTADLDCSDLTGAYALTVGGHDVTIDLNGYRLIAPRASGGITATNRNNLTIRDIDVSNPWVAGIGINILGGTGIVLENVVANKRYRGAQVIGNATNVLGSVSIIGLEAGGSAALSGSVASDSAGLWLAGATVRPNLQGVRATGGAHHAIYMADIDGSDGVSPWTIDATELADVSGALTSIHLAGVVRNMFFQGPIVGLDGLDFGIRAESASNNGLEFHDLNVSGAVPGGSGLSVRGADVVIDTITVGRRSVALAVGGGIGVSVSNTTVGGVGTGLRFFSFTSTDTWPTLSNLNLGAAWVALEFQDWTTNHTVTPGLLAGVDVSGAYQFARLTRAENLTFDGLAGGFVITNPNGIIREVSGTGTANIRLQNMTFVGSGRGTGVQLLGSSHRLSNVQLDGFNTGIYLRAAPLAVLEDVTASGSSIGLLLGHFNNGESRPTLDNVSLLNNATGLSLQSVSASSNAPWLFDNHPDTGNVSVTFGGSRVAITTFAAENVRLANFRGINNPDGGFALNYSNNSVISGCEFNGEGRGTGLLVDGADNTVSQIDVSNRSLGVDIRRFNRGTVSNVIATRCGTGLRVHDMTTGSAPSLANLTLTSNTYGLAVGGPSAFTVPMTVDANVGIDVTDSATGIWVVGNPTASYWVENVVFRNFAGARRLKNPVYGILGNVSIHRNLTFENIDVAGVGRGTGAWISGIGHTISGLTARDRGTGLWFDNVPNANIQRAIAERVAGAAITISNTPNWPTVSGLVARDSGIGLSVSGVVGTELAPTVLGLPMFGGPATGIAPEDALLGSLTSIRLGGGNHHVTVADMRLDGVQHGIDAGSASGWWTNRNLTFEDIDVTGQCRGIGVTLRGQDHRLRWNGDEEEPMAIARRARGLVVNEGERVTATGVVFGANVQGVDVLGGSTIVNTTVIPRASGSNTTTSFRVASLNYMYVGQRLDLYNPDTGALITARRIGSIDTTNSIITIAGNEAPMDAAPPDGTLVRSFDWVDPVANPDANPRLTVTDSDFCANGWPSTGYAVSAGARPVIATGNFWRSELGPTYGAVAKGDVITTTTTATSYDPWTFFPTVKNSQYCNRAPLPNAGPDGSVCQGDTVTLDGSNSTDPDIEPLTFVWSQTAGTGVSLAPADAATTTFVAPAPAFGATETLTFRLDVADDYISRKDFTDVLVRRRHAAPTAAAAVVGGATSVIEGGTLTLAGSGTDPDGLPVTYTWTQVVDDGEPLATVTAGASPGEVIVTAPNVGVGGAPSATTLTFQVAVTDQLPAEMCPGPLTTYATVQFDVLNTNTAPIALAGADQQVPGGQLVTLNGTASFDPDGDAIAGWAWVLLSGPAPADLSGLNGPTPTFTSGYFPADTTLVFGLVVTDPQGAVSLQDSVVVVIEAACDPGDPACNDCYGQPDGTVLEAEVACGADTCNAPTGQIICEGGVPVNTCDPAYGDVLDPTCGTLAVVYAIAYDAENRPRGTIRCTQTIDGVVSCDEKPGSPGVILVYPELMCPGVTPVE